MAKIATHRDNPFSSEYPTPDVPNFPPLDRELTDDEEKEASETLAKFGIDLVDKTQIAELNDLLIEIGADSNLEKAEKILVAPESARVTVFEGISKRLGCAENLPEILEEIRVNLTFPNWDDFHKQAVILKKLHRLLDLPFPSLPPAPAGQPVDVRKIIEVSDAAQAGDYERFYELKKSSNL